MTGQRFSFTAARGEAISIVCKRLSIDKGLGSGASIDTVTVFIRKDAEEAAEVTRNPCQACTNENKFKKIKEETTLHSPGLVTGIEQRRLH